MVNRILFREMGLTDADIEDEVRQSLGEGGEAPLEAMYDETSKDFEVGHILTGRVANVVGDDVVVDVGYKSEGAVGLNEFDRDNPPRPGQEIEVLLEAVEDDSGLIVLSKRKADRIRGWERIINEHSEGDTVRGRVTRKIKGGLLVDIGVNVFLPASQVDIRRPADIAEYIGDEIECVILKIDEGRRNIVVSRRKLIEEQRQKMKEELMAEIEVGQLREGMVKNIADFGAFVDLGGIDGLLHITDMSWGRIGHPSEVVHIDETIEVKILNVDKEREKIALGLKQKSPSPWEHVEEKYPVESQIKGEVVNIMSYGAFVKLEEGVEGLVHISEMSWTRRVNHPSELVAVGDEIDVVVLGINKEKQEISLGMKQTENNPWDSVADKYPAGTVIKGKVRNLTNYGAFVEIEEGIDGLLHVSDMSWTKKVGHPSDVLKKGQELDCKILAVDQDRKRVALGLKQLQPDPWEADIPSRYQPGDHVHGEVTKLTNFGVFVQLEEGLEGLLHISELADKKVDSPEEVVKVGDKVEVKILRVDPDERKIGLSLKRAKWARESSQDTSTKEVEATPESSTEAGQTPEVDQAEHVSEPETDRAEPPAPSVGPAEDVSAPPEADSAEDVSAPPEADPAEDVPAPPEADPAEDVSAPPEAGPAEEVPAPPEADSAEDVPAPPEADSAQDVPPPPEADPAEGTKTTES